MLSIVNRKILSKLKLSHPHFVVFQLFRRGHPHLCDAMKFEPTADFMCSSFADSRSILRVPSLNSSTSSAPRASISVSDYTDDSPVDSTDNQSLYARPTASTRTIVDFTGSVLHQHVVGPQVNPASMRIGPKHGPPTYVNYCPEEINLTVNGWQLTSSSFSQRQRVGVNAAVTPEQQIGERGQNIPPYSPLRIHSSRGARRHSLGSISASNNNSALLRLSPTNELPVTSSRGFPISNRGKGRRSIITKSSATRTYDPDGAVTMLADMKSTSSVASVAPPVDDSPGKHAEMKLLRSVLKRKLPMAASSEAPSVV
jgi:hypothetical protein